jgi:hypothetical protein
VIEETAAYWRVLFDYPPFNIVDATIFEALQDLLARMDASPSLRVVVFERVFDRGAVAAAKNLVNQVSLPSAGRLLDAFNSFGTALTWPEAQQRIQALLDRGLQGEVDFETRWPEALDTLLET